MLRAMYDREARFTRATNEGDHDFATFGNAVLTVETNGVGNGLAVSLLASARCGLVGERRGRDR
jgi:hypothetical protein